MFVSNSQCNMQGGDEALFENGGVNRRGTTDDVCVTHEKLGEGQKRQRERGSLNHHLPRDMGLDGELRGDKKIEREE